MAFTFPSFVHDVLLSIKDIVPPNNWISGGNCIVKDMLKQYE